MKVIIWLASCLALHFLNAFISAFLGLDFKLSAAAVSVIWILVARWLCRKWDNRVLQKQAKASPEDFHKIIKSLPGHYANQLESVRGDRKQVIDLVYQLVERGFIARLYRDQVIDEYSKPIDKGNE